MKNYKMLFPVILILFTVLSVYQLANENIENMNQYNDYLKKARYCASVGVVDAPDYFEAALDIKKSIDVYVEYVKYYIEQGDFDNAEEIAQKMTSDFPGNSVSYDLLMDIYERNKDYTNLFKIYDETQKKKIHSASIDEIYNDNEYVYYTNSKQYTDVKPSSQGLNAVRNEKGFWGFTGDTGGVQIACQYDYAGAFSSGMASVKNTDGDIYYINTENGKKFVFDTDESYDYLGQVVDDIFVVGYEDTYAYYNTSFEKVFGDYQYAGAFSCGIAAVKQENSWMLIDKSGKNISDKFDRILMNENDISCVNNTVIAVKDDVFYILNEKGEVVLKTDFDEIAFPGTDNLLAFKQGEKWGFCDRNGKVVINPEYSAARSFSNGLAAVCREDKWGYITPDNKLAIDFTFYSAIDFNSSGCAYVSDENDYWYIIKLYKYNHR